MDSVVIVVVVPRLAPVVGNSSSLWRCASTISWYVVVILDGLILIAPAPRPAHLLLLTVNEVEVWKQFVVKAWTIKKDDLVVVVVVAATISTTKSPIMIPATTRTTILGTPNGGCRCFWFRGDMPLRHRWPVVLVAALRHCPFVAAVLTSTASPWPVVVRPMVAGYYCECRKLQ